MKLLLGIVALVIIVGFIILVNGDKNSPLKDTKLGKDGIKKIYIPIKRERKICEISVAFIVLGIIALIVGFVDIFFTEVIVGVYLLGAALLMILIASVTQYIYDIRNQSYIEEICKVTYDEDGVKTYELLDTPICEPYTSAQDIADIKKYLAYMIKLNQKKDTQ